MLSDDGYKELCDQGEGHVAIRPQSGCQLCTLLPLIVMLGLGGHFSKNALAPAEPMLAHLGLSPVGYSLISMTPVLCAFALPALWGVALENRKCLVTALVPLGIFASQVVLACGFHLCNVPGWELCAQASLVTGLLLLSCFRAGAEVLQHTVLAHLVPQQSLTMSFTALVISTHVVVMLCNLVVPRAIHDPSQPAGGLLRVQLLLLLPSALGILASASLVCCQGRWACAREDVCHVAEAGEALPAPVPGTVEAGRHSSGWVLIAWGGLLVGLLHALQSITNGLVVSFGESPRSAGDAVAKSQLVSMAFLPVVGLLSDSFGRRAAAFCTSLLVLLATLVLTVVTSWTLPSLAWQAAVLALAMAGAAAPVLPLAYIPRHHRQPGKAYGVLDSVKSLTQAATMLAQGGMRELGGFQAAITFVSIPLATVVLGLALVLPSGAAGTSRCRLGCNRWKGG